MNKENNYRIGVDVGSTTFKMVVLNSDNDIVHKVYKRHKADFNTIFIEELKKIEFLFLNSEFKISVTGSAGIGISERTELPFIQEVVASVEVIKTNFPATATMIDLGGEDAKMVFFAEGKQPDIRMNGNCAGGTGAFIDQMADLMNISIEELALYAERSNKAYPVASRCGVFAKTDVQNLLARNVPIEDISISIIRAVALQSITTLSKGKKIVPQVLCIGGPLTFIPALKKSFAELLEIGDSNMILPKNSEYFPAWGAALNSSRCNQVVDLENIISKIKENNHVSNTTLPPLFKDEKEYALWKKSRKIKPLKRVPLNRGESIECFLGIDSGSTTTKILVMNIKGEILYSFYDSNHGNPLNKAIEGMSRLYAEAKASDVKLRFLSSAATGYGEDLIRSAFNLNYGIVETISHLTGAQYIDPKVSFVLDMGGQDMKSIFTQNGVISNIELNEACSSGCGSFLQNFASTMNISLEEFATSACLAKYPSDLGTRCTVFMNSKVKQSLKENASLGDIAAGLAYSVVKNCLFKVLKISNIKELGNHIVVQGGTFRNDAVYRALEILSKKRISSTDTPELMGALGAALYAKKMWQANPKAATFTSLDSLPNLDEIETKEYQCNGCTNRCDVLRFRFLNGNICFAGNKCEKLFFNKSSAPIKGYNAFDEKNRVLFNRDVTVTENATTTTIGIPRVLNMFENYPFWHTLLCESGLKVKLSPQSTTELYQKGVGTVMSDNICFPAKLVHGHILWLANNGVDRIFYPIVIKEEREFKSSVNSFNCPVVSGYPDVVRSSIDTEERFGVVLDKPVVTFSNEKALRKVCYQYLSSLGVSEKRFNFAFKKALLERDNTRRTLQRKQKMLFDKAVKDNRLVFVVAGRPYHADPLIHQKTGQILADMGADVFTDDIFCEAEGRGFGALNVISQWSYPNRVLQAAMEIAKLPHNVQLVQLNSFGCGPDSFLMDEVGDILKQAGKNHTVLRIDEIASLGSVRLRMRSLIESIKLTKDEIKRERRAFKNYGTIYKKEDRPKTILAPWFADFISPFIPAIGKIAGYKIVNLPPTNKRSAEKGLIYGHNEVCYPSTLVLGDIIAALQSGNYNLDDVVVAITQTGGQCRATNYVAQIKAGLKSAGFSNIPVLVASTGKVYQNEQSAFKVPVLKIINIAIYAILYADALQTMYSTTIVRERQRGGAKQLFDKYVNRGIEAIELNSPKTLLKTLEQAVCESNSIDILDREFTKVGVIGEIYAKYNQYGQANITEWLRSQNIEVVAPPIIDFVMQYFVNSKVNYKNGVKRSGALKYRLNPLMFSYMNKRIGKVEKIMESFRFYSPAESVFTKAEYASQVLDLSNQFGEGWNIAAEVAGYVRNGIERIVCIQPFGCIANHVVAKGIENRLKKLYSNVNLLFLDIDSSIAKVNLQNRLHFLID